MYFRDSINYLENTGESAVDLLQTCSRNIWSEEHTLDAEERSGILADGFDQSQFQYCSLGSWFESIGLEKYKDCFLRNGFLTKDQILQISETDLVQLGITDIEEQRVLLKSIFLLKSNSIKFNCYNLEDNFNGVPV